MRAGRDAALLSQQHFYPPAIPLRQKLQHTVLIARSGRRPASFLRILTLCRCRRRLGERPLSKSYPTSFCAINCLSQRMISSMLCAAAIRSAGFCAVDTEPMVRIPSHHSLWPFALLFALARLIMFLSRNRNRRTAAYAR